jgi:hypothetical protein
MHRFTRFDDHRRRDETGTSLVLVLVFLIIGAVLVTAIAWAATNDLHNTGNFAKARSLSDDATSAIKVASQSIRYTPLLAPTQTLNASPPRACWPKTTATSFRTGEPTWATTLQDTGGYHFRVWCSTRWTPTLATTRTVTFSACVIPETPSTSSKTAPASPAQAAKCASHPAVQEIVTYDDYPTGVATPTQAPCVKYCGRAMTVDSWVEGPTMPKIKLLSCGPGSGSCTKSPLGGPISGGAVVHITGSGFVRGATVQFVEESGGTPSTDNVVLTSTSVHYISTSSLTATSPPVTEGSTYFVRVTTPVGSSGTGSGDVFTYSAPAPTVTSVCTGPGGTGPSGSTCNTTGASTNARGPISGGTEVTIWGTNFLCLTSCTSGGPAGVTFVSGGTSIAAQYVTVVSDSEITTATPAEYQVAPTAKFYVTVTTPTGTSAASVAFDYVGMVPTVESVKYSPQTVVITGTGFVAGDGYKVGFVKDGPTGPTGSSVTSTSVTINSSTTITATVPTLHKGTNYFVTVTSPQGTSSYFPTFKYT